MLAVLQQVDEEVEDLWLQRDLLAAAAQLATCGGEYIVAEQKPQLGLPGWQPGRQSGFSPGIIRLFSRKNQARLQALMRQAWHINQCNAQWCHCGNNCGYGQV